MKLPCLLPALRPVDGETVYGSENPACRNGNTQAHKSGRKALRFPLEGIGLGGKDQRRRERRQFLIGSIGRSAQRVLPV